MKTRRQKRIVTKVMSQSYKKEKNFTLRAICRRGKYHQYKQIVA